MPDTPLDDQGRRPPASEGRLPAITARAPGLLIAGLGAGLALTLASLADPLSGIALAVGLGILARSSRLLPDWADDGLHWAARTVLRMGIVLLGFRLAFSDLAAVGSITLLAVAFVAAATFAFVVGFSHLLALPRSVGILTGAGYAICGASAIAAMREVIDCDDDAPAFAVALVTLFGTLSIVAFPLMGSAIGLSAAAFGQWAGTAVHDVGQVVATAASGGDEALAVAVVVKLARVLLLGPLLLMAVVLWRPSDANAKRPRPRLIPGFIVLFLVAATVRSLGLMPEPALAAIGRVEAFTLTVAMFSLGAGVRLGQLRHLGGRALLLGVVSFVFTAGVALLSVLAVAATR